MVRAVPTATPTTLADGADWLAFLEELSMRVESGMYTVAVRSPSHPRIAPHQRTPRARCRRHVRIAAAHPSPRAASVRLTAWCAPPPRLGAPQPIVPSEPATLGLSTFGRSGPRSVTTITRGLRVNASSLYAFELRTCVYSISISLLSPDEEGGLTEAERGFATAQLHTRHWVLTNDDGDAERVDGPGVVGNFPLFREGGWRDDRQMDSSGRLRRGVRRPASHAAAHARPHARGARRKARTPPVAVC
jgi:hypothetical protein